MCLNAGLKSSYFNVSLPWGSRYALDEPFSGYGACTYTPPGTVNFIETCSRTILGSDVDCKTGVILGTASSRQECESAGSTNIFMGLYYFLFTKRF